MAVVLHDVGQDWLGGNGDCLLLALYKADDAAANFLSLTLNLARRTVFGFREFSLVMIIFSLVDGH